MRSSTILTFLLLVKTTIGFTRTSTAGSRFMIQQQRQSSVASFNSISANNNNNNNNSSPTISSNNNNNNDFAKLTYQETLNMVMEMRALRQEVIQLKNGSNNNIVRPVEPVITTPIKLDLSIENQYLLKLSKEELINKIISYQKNMQKYMINSQDEKRKAVEAANKAAKLKWDELKFGTTTTRPSIKPITAKTLTTTTPVIEKTGKEESTLYMDRNIALIKAAAVGKSRWGDKEVNRISSSTKVVDDTTVDVTSKKVKIDSETKPKQTSQKEESPYYTARNIMLTKATDAGMSSRWGEKELERVEAAAKGMTTTPPIAKEVAAAAVVVIEKPKFLPSTIAVIDGGAAPPAKLAIFDNDDSTPAKVDIGPVPPEVIAADHGLRADGGVNGYTLAERVSYGVNVGDEHIVTSISSSSIDDKKPTTTTEVTSETKTLNDDESLYTQRNANVIAAAQVGKSRWGEPEIERVKNTDNGSGSYTVSSNNIQILNGVTANNNILESNIGDIVNGSVDVKTSSSSQSDNDVIIPPEIIAADHGLRADGGVDGHTLAERVNMGANVGAQIVSSSAPFFAKIVSSSTPVDKTTIVSMPEDEEGSKTTTTSSVPTVDAAVDKEGDLYIHRNKNVLASAQAGKSRWGQQEIDRVIARNDSNNIITNSAVPESEPDVITTTIPPEVEAADHGLRADGGVGGHTLAERVSKGANTEAQKIVSSAPVTKTTIVSMPAVLEVKESKTTVQTSDTTTAAVDNDDDLYVNRNKNVVASAQVGKSRWGQQEVDRVIAQNDNNLNSATSSSKVNNDVMTTTTVIPPEVEAADHGLRADGGVGGQTLADRVSKGANVGEQIVSSAPVTKTTVVSIPKLEDNETKKNTGPTAADTITAAAAAAEEKGVNKNNDDSYVNRNKNVVASAQAGKSRWGQKEVDRVIEQNGEKESTTATTSSSSSSYVWLSGTQQQQQQSINFGASLVNK